MVWIEHPAIAYSVACSSVVFGSNVTNLSSFLQLASNACMHRFSFLVHCLTYWSYLRLGRVIKRKHLRSTAARFIQAGCPSCRITDSVKTTEVQFSKVICHVLLRNHACSETLLVWLKKLLDNWLENGCVCGIKKC